MTESIYRFFKSFDFYKSAVLTSSIILTLFLGWYFENLNHGISIVVGMFVSAPADIPGGRRRRMAGILTANLVAVLASITIHFFFYSNITLAVAMSALVFGTSMISIYGFRASLVSLGALLAIVLSFSRPHVGMEILTHAGFMMLGGLFYLVASQLSYFITHKGHTSALIGECIRLTADYMRIKDKQIFDSIDDNERNQLFELQVQINEKHEVLRDILLTHRKYFGHSHHSKRQLMIFIELVDIYELAVAHIARPDSLVNSDRVAYGKFQELRLASANLISSFEKLAREIENTLGAKDRLDLHLADEQLNFEISSVMNPDEQVYLSSLYDYLTKINQSLEVIENIVNNLYSKDQIWLKGKYAAKFITQQDYDLKTITQNINFGSPIFKHSLRLTVTMLVGFIVGNIFPVQNSYWILLTIVVIMRPGYSLTKERSRQRIFGTLIGASVATGIVLVSQSFWLYAVLASTSFLLAFALIQKNYRYSAIFITLSIIFIYALIQPDVLQIIQYRVIDTLTGAALAIAANAWLWPAWESLSVKAYIAEALKANNAYLRQIDSYYHYKVDTDPNYKLSRKQAFLAIGNLNASFQKMAQEPNSDNVLLTNIYSLVTLNHTFLSLAAALGTYIHNHKTSEASRYFEKYIEGIIVNMDEAMRILNDEHIDHHGLEVEVGEAHEYLEQKYKELTQRYSRDESDPKAQLEIQEVKLISEQLKWLFSISENILKLANSLGDKSTTTYID